MKSSIGLVTTHASLPTRECDKKKSFGSFFVVIIFVYDRYFAQLGYPLIVWSEGELWCIIQIRGWN